jgi:hypothetical protein
MQLLQAKQQELLRHLSKMLTKRLSLSARKEEADE